MTLISPAEKGSISGAWSGPHFWPSWRTPSFKSSSRRSVWPRMMGLDWSVVPPAATTPGTWLSAEARSSPAARSSSSFVSVVRARGSSASGSRACTVTSTTTSRFQRRLEVVAHAQLPGCGGALAQGRLQLKLAGCLLGRTPKGLRPQHGLRGSDRAVRGHVHHHDHVPDEALSQGIVRVLRLHLLHDPRRPGRRRLHLSRQHQPAGKHERGAGDGREHGGLWRLGTYSPLP